MQVIKTSGLLTTRPAPPRAVDIPLASSARYSEGYSERLPLNGSILSAWLLASPGSPLDPLGFPGLPWDSVETPGSPWALFQHVLKLL